MQTQTRDSFFFAAARRGLVAYAQSVPTHTDAQLDAQLAQFDSMRPIIDGDHDLVVVCNAMRRIAKGEVARRARAARARELYEARVRFACKITEWPTEKLTENIAFLGELASVYVDRETTLQGHALRRILKLELARRGGR